MKLFSAMIGTDCPDLTVLLDGLPVGVAWLDGQGRIVMLNRALETLIGFSRDEVRGLPCQHVLRSRACVTGCPHDHCGVPGSAGTETDCINRHRHKIPVRITPLRLPSADGRSVYVLDVVEDLTTLRELERRLAQASGPGQIVGRSQVMEKILSLVPVISQGDSPVLITGETGTGKDLLAEQVHKASPRSREPFVRFNCGPMPADQLEAELFGKIDGRGDLLPGKFQQAQGGTLYLSEIADLPLAQQIQLAHYLDETTILPKGAGKPIKSNVRIVTSTAANPEKLVTEDRLREDLFHRLSVIRLHLPRLKDRGEDVGFLLHHFLGVFAARFKKSIRGIAPKALRLLSSYAYPGNVRELKNIMEYAVMVCSGDMIQPENLPGHLPGVYENPEHHKRSPARRKSSRKDA